MRSICTSFQALSDGCTSSWCSVQWSIMNQSSRGNGSTPGVATADVVIIGAGVIGASIAWALSRDGLRKITVIERNGPASGATGRSGALIRMHYTNAPEASLAIRSFDVFEH